MKLAGVVPSKYNLLTSRNTKNTEEVQIVEEVKEEVPPVEEIQPVEEIVPDKGSTVTMAFTSPTIIVEFPKYQENIIIKNTKGEEFTESLSLWPYGRWCCLVAEHRGKAESRGPAGRTGSSKG